MSKIAEETFIFNKMPEQCISHVLSLTSPRDSCVSSVVSTMFKSAVDSDIVWNKFLPSDYLEILSRMVDDIKFSSKLDLYFKLCSPILIDDDDSRCWKWLRMSDTRIQKVAFLISVWCQEFSAKIESKMLTKKTRYAAYLVYRLREESHGLRYPAQETIIKVGMNESKNYVRLNSYKSDNNGVLSEWIDEIRVSSTRNDGWLEIEMGEFYNDNGDDGEIHICLLETKGGNWKGGLTVYGIEVRPKN